jgi:hypothetical protein
VRWPDALLTVLLAGVSQAIGQSVVLFANRVSPARFALSLLIHALLVVVGYFVILAVTWATFLIPGFGQVTFSAIAIAVAVSYAPLLLSFLEALPYLGDTLKWGLRIAQFVALVTAIAAASHISFLVSTGHVLLGWIAMLVAQHAFGKPITALAVRIADAAAGKHMVAEQAAVQSFARQLTKTPVAARNDNERHARRAKRYGVPIFAGIILTFVLVTAIIIALTPLRAAVTAPFVHLTFLRVGGDLVWVAIVATVVAAFLAPLETLGWFAGWYGDDVATMPAIPGKAATPETQPTRYVIYLDGISQSSSQYTPDVETFLDALEPELPAGMRLLRGIMAYSVVNRPLDDDPMYARFWKLIERLRAGAKTAIIGMFINIRNVMIVAVSADKRYGPLYNLGIAQVIYDDLLACGYQKHSGIPITMIGYSGGGQMCAETAPLLKSALGAPIEIISLAGVMTGTAPFLKIDNIHHLFGSKDIVEPFGPIMFSSRWKIARTSNWNRAMRHGKISITHLGPVGHQVPGGLLDPNYTLPDGRSALRQTLDNIHRILGAH